MTLSRVAVVVDRQGKLIFTRTKIAPKERVETEEDRRANVKATTNRLALKHKMEAARCAARIHQDRNLSDTFAYARAYAAVMHGIYGLRDFQEANLSV